MFKGKLTLVLLLGCFFLRVSQAYGGEEQSKLVEGAKKEGKVVYWSTGLTAPLAKAIEEGFKKRYGLHHLEVVFAPTRTTEVIAKIPQELKIKKLSVDIISGTMPEFYYDLLRAGEAMKYAMYTESGARYLIDLNKMTWKRDGSESNQRNQGMRKFCNK